MIHISNVMKLTASIRIAKWWIKDNILFSRILEYEVNHLLPIDKRKILFEKPLISCSIWIIWKSFKVSFVLIIKYNRYICLLFLDFHVGECHEIPNGRNKSIKEWPAPTTITKIQSFFGLAEFLGKFIGKFSRRSAAPIKDCSTMSKFKWGNTKHDSFEPLKEKLHTPSSRSTWFFSKALLFKSYMLPKFG